MPLAAIKIADSLQQGLDAFFGFVPNLVGFLIILVVGWIVARIVKGVLTKALEKVGLDRGLHSGETGKYVDKVAPDVSPSGLVGSIAYWFIFLGALSIAVSALKIPALTSFVQAIYAYLPNVIAAVLIFVLAGAISAAVGGLVANTMGDTPTGKILGTAVPILVMGIAIFMILNQLKIAPEIVQITYTALIGSVALGAALAFGLGGREVAGRMLDDAYQKGQENKDRVKQDLEKGKDRGRQQAQEAKTRARQEVEGSPDDGERSSGAPRLGGAPGVA